MICPTCGGSGSGSYGKGRCPKCKGHGWLIVKMIAPGDPK
jgi:DnaJ-class molecular chaperone